MFQTSISFQNTILRAPKDEITRRGTLNKRFSPESSTQCRFIPNCMQLASKGDR